MTAVRFANRRNLPPSRVLGLSWPEWGETDVALGLAAEDVDADRCGCGCGFPRSVAHDPSIRDRVVVDAERCMVRAEVEAFRKRDDPDPDMVIRIEILPEGQTRADSERSAYEVLKARMLGASA